MYSHPTAGVQQKMSHRHHHHHHKKDFEDINSLVLLEMWWCLTDDGLQSLTQSRGETSSSLADDGLDDGG